MAARFRHQRPLLPVTASSSVPSAAPVNPLRGAEIYNNFVVMNVCSATTVIFAIKQTRNAQISIQIERGDQPHRTGTSAPRGTFFWTMRSLSITHRETEK
jgi:hypothetical protein